MNIYTSQQLDPIFDSLKTMDLQPAPDQLIDLYIAEPWNKGMRGVYTKPPASEKTKEKCRIGNLGKKHTEQSKYNMGKSMRGKTHSEETKEKMRIARSKQTINDQTRKKMGLAKRGKKRHYREDGSFYMA